MCGIAGFVGKLKNENEREIINKMLSQLQKRGPEDAAFEDC